MAGARLASTGRIGNLDVTDTVERVGYEVVHVVAVDGQVVEVGKYLDVVGMLPLHTVEDGHGILA